MHFARSTPPPRISCPADFRFRTDAAGNIPLSRDWFSLLSRTGAFNRIVLQTRNTCVRLVTSGPLPALTWSPTRESAHDTHGTFTLHSGLWHQAYARLEPCACCASPGKLQVFDAAGAERLQMCAVPEISSTAWAACLAPLAAPCNATLRPAPRGIFYPGPRFHPPAGISLHDPALLPALFDLFAREAASFTCTLPSPAATQRRELTPRHLTFEHGLLTASDGQHTVQIVLPAVHHLAWRNDHRQRPLHLVGREGTHLLELGPAGTPDGACLWSALLHTVLTDN
ncbi:MAG: hypothetical protein K0R17_1267 [Rariglobus sp.]|jgi:hypothetical protein|nr:hypothetical protein [Rariglobus sp.]